MFFSCSRPVIFARLYPLWAGDGVSCGCAVPLKDEVERILRVVASSAGAVCFAPVDAVRAPVDAAHGDGRVLVAHGDGGTDGEVVVNVVAVDVHALAGFFVGEGGVLVGIEVVVGTNPHLTYLRERGALGRGVGRFGECHALTSGGDGVNCVILVDGDGCVFGVVGGAGDVGRVGFHVDAYERLGGAVVFLEVDDACALEDAVDPHGCVEKDGGLHDGGFLFVAVFLGGVYSVSR